MVIKFKRPDYITAAGILYIALGGALLIALISIVFKFEFRNVSLMDLLSSTMSLTFALPILFLWIGYFYLTIGKKTFIEVTDASLFIQQFFLVPKKKVPLDEISDYRKTEKKLILLLKGEKELDIRLVWLKMRDLERLEERLNSIVSG
ncbi:hypothetical protein [Metabacillus sp. 84]|uniref:hypothetical protein n=1 Tax=unclassified Metabacillus TaxID=2675274 RepID=UPI003CF99381